MSTGEVNPVRLNEYLLVLVNYIRIHCHSLSQNGFKCVKFTNIRLQLNVLIAGGH